MASFHQDLNETQIVWEQFSYIPAVYIAVSEVWTRNKAECDARAVSVHRRIDNQDIQTWLSQTDGAHSWVDAELERICVLRIVWMLRDTKRHLIDINALLFDETCSAFRHKVAHP